MEDKNEKLEELEAVEEIKETQQAPSPEEQEGEAAMHDVRIVSRPHWCSSAFPLQVVP